MSGLAVVRSAALAGLLRPASELGTAAAGTGADAGAAGGTDRMLPVLPELRPLLPGRGLRRGATVAVLPTTGAPAQGTAAPVPPPNRPAADRGTGSLTGVAAGAGDAPTAPDHSDDPADPAASAGLASFAGLRPGSSIGSGAPASAAASASASAVGSAASGSVVSGSAASGSASASAVSASAAVVSALAGRAFAGCGPRSVADPLPAAPGGACSLLLALLAEASRTGSWCAVVGVPTLGAVAAAESGIALDRLALIPNPGPEWATVVAALIDGLDVVAVAVPNTIAPAVIARLAARARQRGAVLVPFGRWAGADVTLQVVQGAWEGLGQGRGRLRRREVTICARGRGTAARPKLIRLWLPRATHGFGRIAPPDAVPAPAPHAAFRAASHTAPHAASHTAPRAASHTAPYAASHTAPYAAPRTASHVTSHTAPHVVSERGFAAVAVLSGGSTRAVYGLDPATIPGERPAGSAPGRAAPAHGFAALVVISRASGAVPAHDPGPAMSVGEPGGAPARAAGCAAIAGASGAVPAHGPGPAAPTRGRVALAVISAEADAVPAAPYRVGAR